MIAGHRPRPHCAAGDALPGPDQHVQLHHVSLYYIELTRDVKGIVTFRDAHNSKLTSIASN